jgi:ribosomal protein S6
MTENNTDRNAIYEIGYLISSAVPEENVSAEADSVKKIITDAGATVIAEELAHKVQLAYTISKKTVAGSYDNHDEAYFGWVKFEVDSGLIENIKKAVENHSKVIRMLLISTIRENTYLGKKAPAFVTTEKVAVEDKKDVTPVSIEEMDKSIDAMVKEA